ncbi:protein PALE CRESS, chloroplastic-like [Zingiber officinale]|uniref:protein PALE CRESS, chloroplastic-like n=1 Tax=Zingiber officinale TaxID=94328 RepID=UPI001C4C4099|nr:protein PALE CRESS, chloroplastic-like [Zingiber officinale]
MEAIVSTLRFSFHTRHPLPSPSRRPIRPRSCRPAVKHVLPPRAVSQKSAEEGFGAADSNLDALPDEFYNDEWQARQREKTKEWHAYRKKEEDEERRKIDEYREIGMRLKEYPEEEVRKARKLVSSFIRSAEEVEEKIEAAAEKGELTELVLMVIWNRLDLARRDEEKDVVRSLDLLYRRIETEILKRDSTPAMRLLNDLLNLHDGFDDEGWLKQCRKRMVDTFPREDPFSMLVPAGFDMENHHGRVELPPEDDDVILRVDFVREVDQLLQEVRSEQQLLESPQGLDPETVAVRLKQQEKQKTIHQVEALLELAMSLQW